MEGASVDDISREQLVALVLRLKDRQKELVALCRKGEEEKESLKRGLKKVRDEASSKLAKAKLAVERLPVLEAEVKRLEQLLSQGGGTGLGLLIGESEDVCAGLRKRVALIPAERAEHAVEVLQTAQQCEEAASLARVCGTLLLLKDQVTEGAGLLREATWPPEQDDTEDDEIGAWLAGAAAPTAAEDSGAQTTRAAELSSALETSIQRLVSDYAGLLVQQLETRAPTGESEALAEHRAAAAEQAKAVVAAQSEATAAAQRATQAEAEVATAVQCAAETEAKLAAALQRVVAADSATTQAVAAQNAAESSAADAWAELGLANAKIQEQLQTMGTLHEQIRALESAEHAGKRAQEAELSAIKNDLALKEGQSLEYHNALRKLAESVQYSDSRVTELSKQLDVTKQALVGEQEAHTSAAELVLELRQLADMDVALLCTRLTEERHEFSCELSRLRCELRETTAAAQTSEADVNEKLAIQRTKLQEFRERSKLLMDEKDVEVQRLLDKIGELQEDIKSGRPMERGIFQIAREQAANDRDHHVLKQQLLQAEAQLDQRATQLQEVKQREASLKAQVRELSSQASRGEGVDMEYLKNVVVKYMQSRNCEEQQKMMVPMLANMLHFTPEDLRVVHNAFTQVDGVANVTAFGADWSAVNPLSYIPGYK